MSTLTAGGEGAWEGLGLLLGSSANHDVTDIATTLILFCTQHGPDNWAALPRQELPVLTDEDITWLCGLTEEIVPFEPQPSRAAIDSIGTNGQESTNVLRSNLKRGRRNIPTGDQGASLTPLENTELHATEQCAPQGSTANARLGTHSYPPVGPLDSIPLFFGKHIYRSSPHNETRPSSSFDAEPS